MNSQSQIIEYADFSQSRLPSAAACLDRWYRKQHDELVKAHQELRIKIAREYNKSKRAGLEKQLTACEAKRQDLNSRMHNSSLKRAVSEGGALASLSMTECRIAPVVTPATSLVIDLPADTAGTKVKLNGTAAVYNQWTTVGNGFREKIAPGAFTEVIKDADVRLLQNHNSDLVYARTIGGTLRLYDVPTIGLIFWADMPASDAMTDALVTRIRQRIISGCSFCFCVAEDGDYWRPARKLGELDERVITRISKLLDVGPVTYPQYEGTEVIVVEEARQASPDVTRSDDGDVEREAGFRRLEEAKQKLREHQYRRLGDLVNRYKSQEISPDLQRKMNRKYRRLGYLAARNRAAIKSSQH